MSHSHEMAQMRMKDLSIVTIVDEISTHDRISLLIFVRQNTAFHLVGDDLEGRQRGFVNS